MTKKTPKQRPFRVETHVREDGVEISAIVYDKETKADKTSEAKETNK